MESHAVIRCNKQAELRRQIAALQAQLEDSPPATPDKKRKRGGATVIAACTPSPKKRKADVNLQPRLSGDNVSHDNVSQLQQASRPPRPSTLAPPERPPLKPSNLLSNLATIHQSKPTVEPVERSTGFSEPPKDHSTQSWCQERDDRLALLEKLTPGPQVHPAPVDDPHFERLEPYSGIYLSNRKLPHAELQEHLRGRYYLSPSLMYSVIRPLPSNQGYDIPVPGDWVTIAVIAEVGPIKLTATSSSIRDDDGATSSKKDWKKKGKQKGDAEDKNTRGKKYMSLKLVDFGTQTRTSSASSKGHIRGDALLTLLLFEADSCSYVGDENCTKNSKSERVKVYKGGSGGAFEACMKLHEGAVIAIMNPKILKPYQRNSNAPHPTDNVLAITPTSAETIAIIGRSRDLGMCGAMRRDGKTCGSWCDKRVSECCEYHIEHAVQRKRAGRAEFSTGTSGMTTTPHIQKKPGFDPDRKWGLLSTTDAASRSNGGENGATYVIPGHVISASGPEYVNEKLGRGREERARRKREEKKTDEMLNRLLGRGGGGSGDGGDCNSAARAVRKAREVMKSLKDGKEDQRCGYFAGAIKRVGSDGTSKGCQERNTVDVKRKVEALASLQRSGGDIKLGRRPESRVGSGTRKGDRRTGAEKFGGRRGKIAIGEASDDDELEVVGPHYGEQSGKNPYGHVITIR